MFALGLPGFCSYLYVVRVLQSMQRTKVAFYLYLIENAINIALAVVLVHPLGVRGLALSLSVAYTVSALIGLALLRRWFGPLGTEGTWTPLRRVGVATVAMGIVVLVVSNLSGATHGPLLLARVVGAVVAGWHRLRRGGRRARSPCTWPGSAGAGDRGSRRLVARSTPRLGAAPATARRGRLHPCPVYGS
jgi:O-antigen/teichoic acid export membrane protein